MIAGLDKLVLAKEVSKLGEQVSRVGHRVDDAYWYF